MKKNNYQPSCLTTPRRIVFGYLLMAIVFGVSLVTGAVFALGEEEIDLENLRVFSTQELAAFDGKDGRPAYTAYNGLIYDVTVSELFPEGEHFGHMAGIDGTAALAGAPHGAEVFESIPVVGRLASTIGTDVGVARASRGTILFLGLNLASWTGYLLGLFLILNFMTCYVMPWCARNVPWHGKRPGPDKYDSVILRLSYYHRYFAWLTIIFGIIHGVIGIFQSFGIRI